MVVMKRFLTALQAGSVLSAIVVISAAPGTGHAAEVSVEADAMTGAYYMRDSLVPRADDLALIQRKPALYLASFNDGMATVAYSLDHGRIVYRVVSGEIGDDARAEIDRALLRLQRRIA